MCPTRGVHNAGSAHVIVHGVAICLEDAFELFEKLLWPFTSATQTEVEGCRAPRGCRIARDRASRLWEGSIAVITPILCYASPVTTITGRPIELS